LSTILGDHHGMEKLTSILAVADELDGAAPLLEKALHLARCFQARVTLVSPNHELLRSLDARCAENSGSDVQLRCLRRSDTPAHPALLREAEICAADLIMKTFAGPHPVGRRRADAIDWQLAGASAVPVLLTGTRRWLDPLRLAAAVDVSEPETCAFARGILQAAGFLALGSRGDLDVLYCERETRDDTLRLERAVRLAQMVREFHVGSERLQMFEGAPEKTLPALIAVRGYDVLALGAMTHRTGFAALFANLTNELVDAGDGDVLLVTPSAAPDAAQRGADLSGRSGVSRAAATRPH
jgi:hypothetical protein